MFGNRSFRQANIDGRKVVYLVCILLWVPFILITFIEELRRNKCLKRVFNTSEGFYSSERLYAERKVKENVRPQKFPSTFQQLHKVLEFRKSSYATSNIRKDRIVYVWECPWRNAALGVGITLPVQILDQLLVLSDLPLQLQAIEHEPTQLLHIVLVRFVAGPSETELWSSPLTTRANADQDTKVERILVPFGMHFKKSVF